MSVYINGVEQMPALKKVDNPLPPPGPEWEGILVTCNEQKTDVSLCVLNSVGGYEWIKIGEST
ncbi:unnamed protein product [marine sediment metagenome]|uniref:Uncharacterized protein n=1 Tax=marine sediment metagenome TaxID=412755 RepID=X1FQW4_9ZZZZ